MKRKLNLKNIAILLTSFLFLLVIFTSFGKLPEEQQSAAFEACNNNLATCDTLMGEVVLGNTINLVAMIMTVSLLVASSIFKLMDYLTSENTSGKFKDKLTRILMSEEEEDELEFFLKQPTKNLSGSDELNLSGEEYYLTSNTPIAIKLIDREHNPNRMNQLKKVESNLIAPNARYTLIYRLLETEQGNKFVLTHKIAN